MSSEKNSYIFSSNIQIFPPRQTFSLPEQSIIYYMTKTISSPILYQKLIKCCKYFYQKNPILSLHCFKSKGETWYTCSKFGAKSCTNLNGKKCTEMFRIFLNFDAAKKIWITNYFLSGPTSSSTFMSLKPWKNIPKNIQLKVVTFKITAQEISMQLLLPHYSSFIKSIIFSGVTMADKEISFAKIIQNFPSLEEFYMFGSCDTMLKASKNVTELLQIPHFCNLKKIHLRNMSDQFDFETFYFLFLKQNKRADVHLLFEATFSIENKKKLEDIIDEILELSSKNIFWPPYIYAPFIDVKKKMIWEMLILNIPKSFHVFFVSVSLMVFPIKHFLFLSFLFSFFT